ncbi:TonB-dependent receptor [Catenovulum sediminis]|uniref:TonB-dependent receptor n=1 Tax=Catenovulum sediminis TaxID=1740262 RepID=A0ABV1RCG2_9ALTE
MTKHNNLRKHLIATSVISALGFSSAPAFSAENDGAQQEEQEVIVVRGIRGSLVASMANKRFANSVVDTITATDIGKLPDATIADSLQRITGVQISRSGGEGSSANIRGVAQVMTTLNGEQMLSAGSVTTVQPNFADIPSTMVSGIDVIKSSEAKTLTGGISGTIDLKTNRPFKLDEGYTVLGKVEATQGSMGKETDKTFSAFAGYNLDNKIGATLNLSYADVYLADYLVGSAGGDWGANASETSGFVESNIDATGDGDTNDVFYAFQGHQAANRFIDRERMGANASFQYQLTDALQLTADVFYTEMDEHQYTAGFIASNSWQSVWGWFTPTMEDGILTGATPHEKIIEGEVVDGNYYSFQSGELQARRTMVHSETDWIKKEALNTNLELSYEGDSFTANLRWAHGEASNNNQLSVVDAYINDGCQAGATYKSAEYLATPEDQRTCAQSPVNPWGYKGELATLPDGTPVEGSFTQIPIGISYTADNQHWDLPMMPTADGTGEERLGSNINRYSVTSSNLTGTNSNATLDVLRLDTKWFIDGNFVQSIDTGVRYGIREIEKTGWIGGVAKTNQYGDAFLARWKDSASQAPTTLESYIPLISFTDPLMDGKITQISDFQGSSGLDGLYFVDPKAMDNPLEYHNAVYGTNIQAPDAANTYDLEETTSTFYVQANIDGELSGGTIDIPFSGNIGFRYIRTEFDINQSETGSDNIATFNGQDYIMAGSLGMLATPAGKLNTPRSYNDLLPAINISFDLDSDEKLRFAYNKTMTTHNTDQLAGGITVNRIIGCNIQQDDGSSVFCATSASQKGNPYLDPWRSSNIDLSYEWYFSETGMFNIGAFYMDIESFIVQSEVELPIPDTDGVVRGYVPENPPRFKGTVTTTTPANSPDGGTIRGLEVGYQQGFDFLPGKLSGLGLTANYTWSPSTSGSVDYYGKDTPMSDNSEHQANLAVWYEKDGLQARIASNYRSKKFISIRNVNNEYQFAKFQEPTLYVDASVSYDFNEQITLSLQGTNLTEESQAQYFQWEDMVDKRYYNERRLTLGLQVRL